jgi:hypothetical protein
MSASTTERTQHPGLVLASMTLANAMVKLTFAFLHPREVFIRSVRPQRTERLHGSRSKPVGPRRENTAEVGIGHLSNGRSVISRGSRNEDCGIRMWHAATRGDFSGRVRRWRDDKPGGLAVVDIPEHLVADLGGRRQMRVTGSLNDAAFTGSTMLVAGGGLCVGVSKAALKSASAAVGDQVRLSMVAADS